MLNLSFHLRSLRTALLRPLTPCGRDDERGLTLVELMVAMTVSLIILTSLAAFITVFSKPDCAAEGASACLDIDFMGVNGRVSAPLLSANIPQGTYTSANAVVTQCRADVMGATASGGAGMTDTCDIAPGVVAPNTKRQWWPFPFRSPFPEPASRLTYSWISARPCGH